MCRLKITETNDIAYKNHKKIGWKTSQQPSEPIESEKRQDENQKTNQ